MSAYTQDDLNKLLRARLRRAKSTTFSDGRRVEWVTGEDLERLIDAVRRELAASDGRQTLLAKFSKGVEC